MVNGLELDPAPGVSLTLDSATGTLSSNGGAVTIKLGNRAQHQTTFEAHPISWRVVPNPGESSIDAGSTGHFAVNAGGTVLDLPALSLNDIQLIQDKSNVSFTAGVPIPSLASFFGTIKATATMLSDNQTGAHFDGLDAEIGASQKPVIKDFKVAEPFKAFSGHLKFTLSTNTWYVSLLFTVPGAGGISASTTVTNGAPTEITFDASYKTPGLAIGDTGAFLQDVHGRFVHYPHVSHPKIGLTQSSGNAATDAARAGECATINQYYAQYIALNTAFPSYCGAVGQVSFDPPLEVDGGVQVSAGPVIGTKSALVITGDFRYVDTYNDGTNTVPWLFNVQGGVTMLGLPFNRTPQQVYPNSTAVGKSSYVPVNNSGKQAWATIHGDGLVEAGGGSTTRSRSRRTTGSSRSPATSGSRSCPRAPRSDRHRPARPRSSMQASSRATPTTGRSSARSAVRSAPRSRPSPRAARQAPRASRTTVSLGVRRSRFRAAR